MEPLESPRVEQVGGIVNRGEDTDGERTDDEAVDFPSGSFISQHEDEQTEPDEAEQLEVTSEGTAGGPFGLKKVLFVRKKSDRNTAAAPKEEDANKPQEPSFKDRFNKLGAGVGAALGSIIQQDHSKAPAGAGGGTASKPETPASAGKPGGDSTTGPSQYNRPNSSKTALEYFEEYEMVFSTKPRFSIVEGAEGKGAVVTWEGEKGRGDHASALTSAKDAGGAEGGPTAAAVTDGVARMPPSGAVILAVAGKSVVDAKAEDVAKLLVGEGGESQEAEASMATATVTIEEEVKPYSSDSPGGPEKPGFKLVVRFREKTGPRQGSAVHGGANGGEIFRNRVKAMATGFGNLFQVKETSGSAARDGSDDSGATATPAGATSAAAVFDAYVLTFKTERKTADDLPFTMAEMIGGGGVVVTGVNEDYASALVQPNEEGVFTAGTGAVAEGTNGTQGGDVVKTELAPGAVLLRVAGKNVEGKKIGRVRKELDAAAEEHSAVKILFRRAPPIYRASVAAELTSEAANKPHVHVGTWQPLLKRRAGVTIGGAGGDTDNVGGSVIGIGYGGEEWEDVRETMARAHRFVNGFRSVGIRVNVLSSETMLLPRNFKSAYAGSFDGRFSSFQQSVRLWFSFPDEKTVSLEKQPEVEKLGLNVVDTKGAGALGPWVTVTAQDGSPCAEAGLPVGENVLLTHVNGFDLSPMAYRSLAPSPPGGEGNGWARAVVPALESGDGDTITLTFV